MGAVERVDVTAALVRPRPSRRLHGAGHLQRELAEVNAVSRLVRPALPRKPPQVAIGRHVAKPVVVYADVADVTCHVLDRIRAAKIEESLITRRVELQNLAPELKPLRPFRPTLGRVHTLPGEHRRTFLGVPRPVQTADFPRRQPAIPVQGGSEIAWCQCCVKFHLARAQNTTADAAPAPQHYTLRSRT